jgi:homoserine O-acetyltransferase
MVASQLALIDHLGVGRLKCVIGASMGGMQALQWAVSHGERIERLVAMTPMARTTPWAAVINETSRRALLADPGAPEPDALAPGGAVSAARPNPGWAAWVPLMHLISGRTPAQIDREFSSAADVIEWIGRRTRWWTDQGFDAIDWIYQSRAYDAHDVGLTPGFAGDTDRALGSVTVPALILAPPLDLYNPAHEARAVAERMPAARFVEIPSDWGHQAASPADPAAADLLNRLIGEFLVADQGAAS